MDKIIKDKTKLKVQKPTKLSMHMSSPFKDLNVAFNLQNTDFKMMHEHNHWEILIVLSGIIKHTINGEETILHKGDACIIRPHDIHNLVLPNENLNYLHINYTFDNDTARTFCNLHYDYKELLNYKNTLYFSINDDDLSYIQEKILFTQNLPKDEYSNSTKLLINYLFVKFFEQFLFYNPTYPNWLNKFLDILKNPVNFDKSVQELAKLSPYSYSQLSRIFKKHLNTSIMDYVNNAKLTYSKRLLRTTRLTTLAISLELGYNSLSTFNHIFKNAYGITPSQYRKNHLS